MEPSTEAGILTMLGEGDDFVVVDDSMKDSGWVIVTTEEGDGYVSTDYVNLWTDYVTAESKAEEEARLAKEEAERQAAAAAAACPARRRQWPRPGPRSGRSGHRQARRPRRPGWRNRRSPPPR